MPSNIAASGICTGKEEVLSSHSSEITAVGQRAIGQRAIGQRAVGQRAVGQRAIGQRAVGLKGSAL